MRRVLGGGIFIVLVSVALGSYLFQTALCTKSIPYRIGNFDTEFGISQQEFIKITKEAAEVWGEPKGKPLFVYDPDARMSVNLIFDSRQITTNKNKELQTLASQTKETADMVKAEYEALEKEYRALKSSYDSSLLEFQTAQNKYNSDVDYYNKRGGAPKDVYNRLIAEKASLERQGNNLDNKKQQINSLAEKINSRIRDYNNLIKEANSNIHVINQSAGKEFDEGEYVSDENGQRINIYEFTTEDELKRVLSHEFGHALGLLHNSNPDSIMYYLNESSNQSLTPEDKTSLAQNCGLN